MELKGRQDAQEQAQTDISAALTQQITQSNLLLQQVKDGASAITKLTTDIAQMTANSTQLAAAAAAAAASASADAAAAAKVREDKFMALLEDLQGRIQADAGRVAAALPLPHPISPTLSAKSVNSQPPADGLPPPAHHSPASEEAKSLEVVAACSHLSRRC